jgi:hypothetical protein
MNETISCRLLPNTVAELQSLVDQKGGSVSKLIREAVDAYLRHEEEETPQGYVGDRIQKLELTIVDLLEFLKAALSKKPDPPLMNEAQLKWVFDRLLYIGTVAEFVAADSKSAAEINAKYTALKQKLTAT